MEDVVGGIVLGGNGTGFEPKNGATILYGLSQDEWKTFVSDNAISHEMVATQASIDEVSEKLRSMKNAQKNYRQSASLLLMHLFTETIR